MTTQRNANPHRIVITILALVFSYPDFVVTPIFASGALQRCFPLAVNHSCTINGEILPLVAFVFHVAAWAAFFVMAYGWIVGSKVRRAWPLAGTTSSLVSIFLISLHIPGKVGPVVLMAGSSICLAIYLCYFHLFSTTKRSPTRSVPSQPLAKNSNAGVDRLAVFVAATSLSFIAVIGAPIVVMMAAIDVTSKGGIAGVQAFVSILMLISMFYSYGVMGVR